METVKLAPCAHCGSTDNHLIRTVDNNRCVLWHVECYGCGIRTADYEELTKGSIISTAKEHDNVLNDMQAAIDCAVSMWNKRV